MAVISNQAQTGEDIKELDTHTLGIEPLLSWFHGYLDTG